MVVLDVETKPIDTVSLMEQFTAMGKLESSGGVAYVAQLPDGIPKVTNVPHYAAIVAEKSRLRQLIYTSQEMMERAMADGASPKDITADLAAYAKHAGNGHALALVSVDFFDFLDMELPPRDHVIEPLIAAREQGIITLRAAPGKPSSPWRLLLRSPPASLNVSCGKSRSRGRWCT